MLEKKKNITDNITEKISDYYKFIHRSDIKPKVLKRKIKYKVQKSLKKKIASYNRRTRKKKL